MKCHVCGAEMEARTTNLPFKLSDTAIVILKDLPVIQCGNCGEYVIEDPIMQHVDAILDKVDAAAELEIIQYAV